MEANLDASYPEQDMKLATPARRLAGVIIEDLSLHSRGLSSLRRTSSAYCCY